MAFDIALQGQDGDLTSVFVPHCGVGGWMVLQYLVDIYMILNLIYPLSGCHILLRELDSEI